MGHGKGPGSSRSLQSHCSLPSSGSGLALPTPVITSPRSKTKMAPSLQKKMAHDEEHDDDLYTDYYFQNALLFESRQQEEWEKRELERLTAKKLNI